MHFLVTAQQCYAFVQNATPGAGTWTGSQTKNGSLSADIFSGQATITPTAVGTYTYAMTCAGTESGSASLTVNAPPPLTFTPPALLSGTVGTTYTATMNANGGVKPYTWSWSPVSGSSLPPGLTLAPNTGVLTGTPSQSGTFNFSVEVADSQSTPATQTASLSLAIAPQPPPSISADPTTVTITSPGASGSTKLSFSNFSGGTVSLTCSGLPKGATCKLSLSAELERVFDPPQIPRRLEPVQCCIERNMPGFFLRLQFPGLFFCSGEFHLEIDD